MEVRATKGMPGFYVNDEGVLLRVMKPRAPMPSTLIRENWRYDWIKNLADDEEATPVRGFEGYFITSHGRLYNEKRNVWQKPQEHHVYYDNYVLSLDGKPHNIDASTLVGKHFLEGWNSSLEVCHIDEELPQSERNKLTNLWLGTPKENHQDAVKKGRKPSGK